MPEQSRLPIHHLTSLRLDAKYFSKLDLCTGYWQVEIMKRLKEDVYSPQFRLLRINNLPLDQCSCYFPIPNGQFDGVSCILDDISIFSESFDKLISHILTHTSNANCFRSIILIRNKVLPKLMFCSDVMTFAKSGYDFKGMID